MGRPMQGHQGRESFALRRGALALAAGGFLAAVGCGSSSGAADAGADGDGGSDTADADTGAAGECAPRSGTRLSFQGYEGPGGEVTTTGLSDSELGASCSYRQLGGAWRCVPFTPTLYRNADCTDPIGVSHDDGLPRYHVIDDPGCDPDSDTVYAVGEELPGAGTFYLESGAGCAAVENPGGLLYELGDPVEPSVFVTAEVVELGSGRIRILRFDGDDGSSYCHERSSYRALRDTELGVSCAPAHDVDDVLRCMPAAGFATQVATEAACTTEVDATAACTDDVAYAWRSAEDDICPASREILTVEDELPAAYGLRGGVCTELGPHRALGEVVEPTTFATLTEERVGDGRLQRQVLVTPAGQQLFDGEWYDTVLGAPCRAREGADGVRCMPYTTFSVESHYIDADCTTLRDVVRRSDADCGGARHVEVDGRVHRIGDEIGTVYTDSGGTCGPLPAEGLHFYEIGAEVTDFVELTPLPEP